MRIAVIGATGRAGREITAELARRGHHVTAISRHPEKTPADPNVTPRAGDATDAAGLPALLAGHDAVVSAVMFKDTDPATLVGAVRAAKVPRYLVVGGAGSLEVAPGQRLVDQPDFPAAYRAEATRGAAFLDHLKQVDDLDWTFLSPSALFFEGPRTGRFRLGDDQLLSNDQGSSISFADYAIAMADEIEAPRHARRRFTVGY
ncbi:NAD(P)-dependent oxidoreductase [Roseomonas sp. NAR14]|uniref:NAD(P)-dependent oxidoreductase n=1 Tax=Roseomonas acroporae TaxID=2937791 RepID=A0A9X1Y6C8_9PROT|nr:NAD(P)-dependent oxidoreductase [Roseomonas acroporae]MCK8783952.1 NAD(P)-dependent oxidoreductase [Roseomonas acroporae]